MSEATCVVEQPGDTTGRHKSKSKSVDVALAHDHVEALPNPTIIVLGVPSTNVETSSLESWGAITPGSSVLAHCERGYEMQLSEPHQQLL